MNSAFRIIFLIVLLIGIAMNLTNCYKFLDLQAEGPAPIAPVEGLTLEELKEDLILFDWKYDKITASKIKNNIIQNEKVVVNEELRISFNNNFTFMTNYPENNTSGKWNLYSNEYEKEGLKIESLKIAFNQGTDFEEIWDISLIPNGPGFHTLELNQSVYWSILGEDYIVNIQWILTKAY